MVIGVYEKFHPIIMKNRINSWGELSNPGALKGYELLYKEAKRLYPLTEPFASSMEESLEHTRRIQEYLRKNPAP